MNGRQHMDPRRAEALEAVLVHAVKQGATRSHERRRPPGDPRQRIVSAVATAVVGAIVLLISVAVLTRTPTPAPAEQGKPSPSSALRYAGDVPWSGAIADPDDPRVLTVLADGDSIRGPIFVCGLPVERRVVVETDAVITIAIQGYVVPLPSGKSCGGVGHPGQLLTVRLRQPLGDRVLRDAGGRTHRVLHENEVPRPAFLPAAFDRAPAGTLLWDERERIASRSWSAGSSRDRTDQGLSISIGAADKLESRIGGETAPTSTTIAGRPAEVRQHQDVYNWDLDVIIHLDTARAVAMHYRAWPARHVSRAELLRVADSIRF